MSTGMHIYKNSKEAASENDINQNILNIITPSGLSFGRNYCHVGEFDGKIYAVSRYPGDVKPGWLAPLCNMEGAASTIEYVATDSASLIDAYNNRIRELKGNREIVRNTSDRQIIEKQIEDTEALLKRINIEEEPVGYINIMVYIKDVNDIRLSRRIKKVNAVVSGNGFSLRMLTQKQKLAYGCITPYGLPNPVVANIGNRNMPISTFLGGFPMSAAGIRDSTGWYLGKSGKEGNKRVVILDPWLRGGDRLNSNFLITGTSGSGKSATIKDIVLMEWALGTKIFMLDPEKEFMELAKNIGGIVIDCMGGANGKINPLQIKPAPEDVDEGSDSLYPGKERGQLNDLSLHIQNLRMFFKLYKPDLDDTQLSYIEKALIVTYKKFGITWDTDVKTLKNTDYPLLKDVYVIIRNSAEDSTLSQREREIYESVRDKLYSLGEGADSFIWNAHTSIEDDNSFIVLDTSKYVEADEGVKNAQSFNILTYLWSMIARDREERVLVGIDEGYTMVDTEMPYSIKYIRNMVKRDRKYNGGVLFITQSINDILDPAVKRFGQAIIDNSCYKILMGTDGKNLQETVELFNLTEKESMLLAAKKRGKALLYAGATRVELQVDISEKFLKLFGKAGGR